MTDPPSWLKKSETKASFGFKPYERRSYTEAETIAKAFVTEVSILEPRHPARRTRPPLRRMIGPPRIYVGRGAEGEGARRPVAAGSK